LLDAAKDFGAETNSKWLILQTAADNFTAQKVYEKNGWVKETDFFYRKEFRTNLFSGTSRALRLE
jgi:RimJ/RimL family protein N-acetyltransferase